MMSTNQPVSRSLVFDEGPWKQQDESAWRVLTLLNQAHLRLMRSLKRMVLGLTGGIAAFAFCGTVSAGAGPGSLVPAQPSTAPDYFCTFNGQAYYHPTNLLQKQADKYARQDPNHAQATLLNEETLLGSNGLARTLFPETRSGLYFLLDDGWDVPIVAPEGYYGSLILDTDKFPSFTGTPAERLGKLNRAFKALGWRGIGLWVACQESPAILKQQAAKYAPSKNADEPLYWVERMKWMAEADIEYWKVDWGTHDGNVAFRGKLTRLAEKYAPNLRVEHATVCAPFNTPLTPAQVRAARLRNASWVLLDQGDEQGRVCPKRLAQFKQRVPVSHVLRLYDITGQLGIPTMLDRVDQVLASFGPDHPTQCLLNCEIIPYIGAGLGCAIGIMSQPPKDATFHPQIISGGRETCDNLLGEVPPGQSDAMRLAPLYLDSRMLETVRTLRWHRIAPPFPVGGHATYTSSEILSDSWDLRSPPTWYSGGLKDVMTQRAPAVICRNIEPVTVEVSPTNHAAPNLPYVVASRHPNGAIAIATLGRVSPNWGYVNPGAVIRARVGTLTAPLGLFGLFHSVTLEAENITTNMTVWAQDLAGNKSVDITSKVRLQPGSLTVPGSVARELCPRFNDFDLSEPGIVLVLRAGVSPRPEVSQ
jgi:hypothetical protein